MLKDPDVRAEYQRLENEFTLAHTLRAIRQSAGLTQQEVANRMHTTRPQVAKLESGNINVRIDSLARYATACGKKINWGNLFS